MEYPYSLAGRVIQHRSTPWYDKRIRSQPYEREEQLPMDHTMAPPDVVMGAYGQPLTKEQRMQKHYARFGTDLPPRGTGMGRGIQYGAGVQKLGFDWGSFIAGGVLALIFGYFIFTSSGRRIGYAAGQRIERRIR